MAASRTQDAAAPAAAAVTLAGRRRRKPSATEQARRVAWGHKFGPLVGRTIREAIRNAEA